MLLGSLVQTQSTQQENVCLQGVLWRTCNAWIIFVCSSGAKWTDRYPEHSKIRCWILFWLNKLPLTTAPSHPGGSFSSADGRAAAHHWPTVHYEGPLCGVVCLGSAPHLKASDPASLCHERDRSGAQIQMQMLVSCIKKKLVFGEICLLAYLVPALNCPSPSHRVTLFPSMVVFVFHWSFDTCISSLPKFNSSTTGARMCFLYVHGQARRAIQTG